jgi:hypothetical protein
MRGQISSQSDQYALAVTYTQLRGGRLPFEGSPAFVMTGHLENPPDLTMLPERERPVVARALAKEPTDRWPSCREFAEALAAANRPVQKQRDWKWAAVRALLLATVILGAVLWFFRTPPAQPPSVPQRVVNGPSGPPELPPPPHVDWDPEKHGFTAPAGTQIQEVDGKRYYERITRPVGGTDVVFLLIPREKTGDPQTFYIMENKVSNGVFKAVSKDAKFKKAIAEWKQAYPKLKVDWENWRDGGKVNGKNLGSAEESLPVLGVNLLEACSFAQWVGGNLPTGIQWDMAGGRFRSAKAPFRDPDDPVQVGDIATARKAGPMPVGTAPRDESLFHCRDMAGNGLEWTRDIFPGGSFSQPFPAGQGIAPGMMMIMRGRSYVQPEPFRFDMNPDYRPFNPGDPWTGFRVVVEP